MNWRKNLRFDDQTKGADPEVITLPEHPKQGRYIPYDNPENWVIKVERPADLPPDLATKPDDIVGYCFGYVCPKKHVQGPFETISVDGCKQRRACQTCGGLSQPAIIKRTGEAQWRDFSRSLLTTGGSGVLWNHYQFVSFLDLPKKPRRKRK